MSEPSDVVTKTPIRKLADFKGKKLRIFAFAISKRGLRSGSASRR